MLWVECGLVQKAVNDQYERSTLKWYGTTERMNEDWSVEQIHGGTINELRIVRKWSFDGFGEIFKREREKEFWESQYDVEIKATNLLGPGTLS